MSIGDFCHDENFVLVKDKQYCNDDIISVCCNQVMLLNSVLSSPDILIANEGMLKNLFIAITDTLFHVGNNFKTMFKMYKDFKRSELRYYLESNPMKVKDVLDVDYRNIAYVKVPVPKGMVTSYLAACIATDTCLKAIDMPMRVKIAYEFVRQIRVDIDAGKFKDVTADSVRHISIFTGKEIERTFNDVNEVFVQKKTNDEVTLSSAYSSIQEIHQVNEKLLLMESHLSGVSNIFSYLDSISHCVDGVIKLLEDNEDIKNKFSPNDLIKLAESIRVMAVLFEKYGLVINDVNRLNHNQMEVLETIRRYRKM